MDYTKSAVGLTNPEELKAGLETLKNEQEALSRIIDAKGELAIKLRDLQEKINACLPPDLKARQTELEEQETDYILMENQSREFIIKINQEIKKYCETQNASYQDLEAGYWAIKQKKKTVTYLPDKVKANLTKEVAAMVIVEAVDPDRMAGMIKGKLVTAEAARACAKIETKYSYIVKVEPSSKEG